MSALFGTLAAGWSKTTTVVFKQDAPLNAVVQPLSPLKNANCFSERLLRLLGFLAPIAARLLQLREIARLTPKRLAIAEMPQELVKLLAVLAEVPPDSLTVGDFWRHVARFGGYLGRQRRAYFVAHVCEENAFGVLSEAKDQQLQRLLWRPGVQHFSPSGPDKQLRVLRESVSILPDMGVVSLLTSDWRVVSNLGLGQ
jgi:hypothetical protein